MTSSLFIPAGRPPSASGRAFSLIELLTVVSIIALMATLMVVAVNGLGRSAELTRGGDMVVNLAALARQTALSKNTLAALVLLGDQGTAEDFRAFGVLEYQAGAGWFPVGKWETLAEGVVVDRSDLANCTFLTDSPQPFPFVNGPPRQSNPPCFYQGQPVRDGTGYAARIFLPQGGLANAEAPAQIRLVEGVLRGAQVVYTRRKGTQTANFYDIAILGATGGTKVSRP